MKYQQICQQAVANGFEVYWSGLESGNCLERGGMEKTILTNKTTGDVVDVWENGHFEVYNQYGNAVTFAPTF